METECILPLLSLDAHNHVDDYSGTLGGVRKVLISALVVLKIKLLHCLKFILSLSLSLKKLNKQTKINNKKTS